MRNRLLTLLPLATLCALLVPGALAQPADGFQDPETQKLAQTGMKFLSVSVDPRAAAMGDAMTAQSIGNSVAQFYNPATMAYQTSTFHAGVNQTMWIADITYNAGSISFNPVEGRYGVFGLSVVAVDYGAFIGTVRENTESGYRDTGEFSPTAMAVGLGYARALTDRFAVGGNVKYVTQDLGSFLIGTNDSGGALTEDYSQSTVAFDFGVLYDTGFRGLTFAMSARNFSRELSYAQENFELPLTFRIGVAADLMQFTSMNPDVHSFRLSVDAERPRDFAEQIKVGGEYLFMNTFALRAGYAYPTDTQGVNLGVGLQRDFGTIGFAFNYAYTTFDVFDNVNRLGIQVSF